MQAKHNRKPRVYTEEKKAHLKMKRLAQTAWNKLCETPLDYERCVQAVKKFMRDHPNLKPEAFEDSGFTRYRLTWDLLGGKTRESDSQAGILGRLRYEHGLLERRRINITELGISENLAHNPYYQFLPESADEAFNKLKRHVPAFYGALERGRINLENHLEVVVPVGTCKLGVSNGVIPDDQLVMRVQYLLKNPEWTVENAVAYLMARNHYRKQVAKRYRSYGIPNARTKLITVKDVESAVGYSLARPSAVESLTNKERVRVGTLPELPSLGQELIAIVTPKITEHSYSEDLDLSNAIVIPESSRDTAIIDPEPELVKAAALPMLKDATLETLELVGLLHDAWASGWFDGKPGKIGAAKALDMGAALGHYFNRKKLFGGEVYDLEKLALSLNLQGGVDDAEPFELPLNTQILQQRPHNKLDMASKTEV